MRLHHEGLHPHRLKANPKEKAFADVWKKHNTASPINPYSGLLTYLLSKDNTPVAFTQRDAVVAATIIQWLGSPVGQAFLKDVEETFSGKTN